MIVHWNKELANKAHLNNELIPDGFRLGRASSHPDRGVSDFVIVKDHGIGLTQCRVEIGDWIVVLDCGATIKFSDEDFHENYEEVSNG